MNQVAIRKLHIGGMTRKEGWEVLNANPGPEVDHVRDASDMSCFADDTFDEIYASHVLEHFDYVNALEKVIKEWKRILKPGGCAYISVPDMDTLCRLFLSNQLTMDQRYFVMKMIFGGHLDRYDYHMVGLNEDFLAYFFDQAGYVNIRRVENFNIFSDTSEMLYLNVPVSVNMIVEKPSTV
jgi:predicted SAM-dependent methyltransferase